MNNADRFRREAQKIIGELESAVEISDFMVDRFYRNGLGDLEYYSRRLQRVVVAAHKLCTALINDGANRVGYSPADDHDPLGDIEYPDAA